tara:strand:+ start:2523 stop:3395 length:873 start_codon:yes stop_codon:yes gene_type:complete
MVWQAIGAIAGVGSALSGYFGQKKAYKQGKQYQYDLFHKYTLPGYEMGNEKLIADHAHLVKSIELQRENEIALAEFKDKNNLRNWHQRLKINQFAHGEKMKEFNKSEHLYHQSVGDAKDQKKIRDEETYAQFAYQNEDRILESIVAKSNASATSQTGASAVSEAQAVIANNGRELSIMRRNLVSANRESRMQFKDFLRQADANRMIMPTKAPDPLKPLKTPIAKYQMPRPLEDFDFGPKPIMGMSSTPKPSLFGSALGAVAGGFSAYNDLGGTDFMGDLKSIGGYFTKSA